MRTLGRVVRRADDQPSLERIVECVVDLLATDQALSEAELVKALAKRTRKRTATRVVCFAEIAFGRRLLREAGLGIFSDDFRGRINKTMTEPLPLNEEPEYLAAETVAARSDLNAVGVKALATRSSEVAVLYNALKSGVAREELKTIRLSEPLILSDIF